MFVRVVSVAWVMCFFLWVPGAVSANCVQKCVKKKCVNSAKKKPSTKASQVTPSSCEKSCKWRCRWQAKRCRGKCEMTLLNALRRCNLPARSGQKISCRKDAMRNQTSCLEQCPSVSPAKTAAKRKCRQLCTKKIAARKKRCLANPKTRFCRFFKRQSLRLCAKRCR